MTLLQLAVGLIGRLGQETPRNSKIPIPFVRPPDACVHVSIFPIGTGQIGRLTIPNVLVNLLWFRGCSIDRVDRIRMRGVTLIVAQFTAAILRRFGNGLGEVYSTELESSAWI
jgi:hypothetical protein